MTVYSLDTSGRIADTREIRFESAIGQINLVANAHAWALVICFPMRGFSNLVSLPCYRQSFQGRPADRGAFMAVWSQLS
jgi:hypothetical protein